MTIADLVIKISADTAAAEAKVAGFGSKVAGGFKKAIVPATVALTALGLAAKVGFGNLMDGARNAAQTNAVLKSTGGAANVTAKHVDELAMSLRRKAGVDDDVVHSGENMLLTFTHIRNEAGKGNQIFDQATKVMLDMSKALGQDTKSSAIQLGKALNDPIRGVTALQRVGVTFTAAQKKQIKTLVESGHAMDAQKLILRELNKEFGGSATNIDPLQRKMANLKLDLTDAASSITAALLPALSSLVGIVAAATGFLTAHSTATKVLVGVIAGLAGTVLIVNAALKVYAAGQAIVKAATVAWTAVQWALNAALAANPIALVIIALVALGTALVIAWTKSETFRNIVTAAWNAIKNVTMAVFNFIRDHIRTIMAALLVIFTGGLGAIALLVIAKWGAIKAATIAAWNGIKATVSIVIGAVLTIVRTGFSMLQTIVSTTLNAVRGTAFSVWTGIKEVVRGAVEAIKSAVRTGFNALSGIIRGVAGAVRAAAGAIRGALQPIIDVLNAISGAASGAASAIDRVVGIARSAGGVLSKIKGAIPGFASGTSFAPGGLAVVGERGPELVNLPRGSSVFTNSESKRMLSSGGDSRNAPLIGQVVVNDGTDVEVLAQRVARVLAFQS